MAKMKFGPWVRPSTVPVPKASGEYFDVVAVPGHSAWIKPEMVKGACLSPAGWKTVYGEIIEGVTWVRERIWGDPADIDVQGKGHRQSLDFEHNQDGSATIRMHDGCNGAVGEITIAADQMDTLANWFAAAHRSNQL